MQTTMICPMNSQFLAMTLLNVMLSACTPLVRGSSTDPRAALPNLVIISCDDLGWGDIPGLALPGYAPPSYTKDLTHIARLEREGVLFTNFYSAQPVCSASRAALLTGCYPNRVGIHGALFPTDTAGIGEDEFTLAEMLRNQGYATGVFGKWHLGHREQHNPTKHGFDEFFGIPYSHDMWKARFQGHPPLLLYDRAVAVESIDDLEEVAALTDRLTARACAFIRNATARQQPFFAYVPHPQPHTPLAASDRFKPIERCELYGAVLREIDWSVGEILRTLEETGADKDTIVLFTSDNGPWLAFGCDAGSTGGLREGKGTTFEGGVRVPCVLRWPGRVPQGATSDTPWMTIDLFATMAAIVRAAPSVASRPIDGNDAREIWSCDASARPSQEAFYFYYHTNALEAVRVGKWKLCLPHASRSVASRAGLPPWGEAEYQIEQVPLSLYDLDEDPSEQRDLAKIFPEVVQSILQQVEHARADLGDSLTHRTGRGVRGGRAGGGSS